MVSLRLLNRRRTLHPVGAPTAKEPVKMPEPGPTIPEPEQEIVAETKGRGWWDLLPFPTHRIPIAGDLWTNIEGVQAGDDVRTAVLLRYCGGSFEGKTIADLGCLEGAFAVEFARRGAKHAIGIEARQINFERCELIRKLLQLPNLQFIQADVKEELPKWEQRLDVVLMAGLLYHLSDPFSMLRAIHSAMRDLVLIDTHVAHLEHPSHGCSELVTHSWEGYNYRGRIFREYTSDISKTAHEKLIWAAWSDETAFWLLEQDLLQMCKDVGFSSVEKVDPTHYGSNWYVDQSNRVLVVCRR